MKKKLLILCSILLIIGCSKAEPQQEEELTVVKSSVATESVEVAGASYNPNVQGGVELEEVTTSSEVEATAIEATSDTSEMEAAPKTEKKKSSSKKYISPTTVAEKEVVEPDVSDTEIDSAIKESVQEKIKEDEKITKDTKAKEVFTGDSEEMSDEKPDEKKGPSIWIILGGIAAAAGVFLFKKK